MSEGFTEELGFEEASLGKGKWETAPSMRCTTNEGTELGVDKGSSYISKIKQSDELAKELVIEYSSKLNYA